MKDNFLPAFEYYEVEPMETSGPLVSDEKKFVEKAKVIGKSFTQSGSAEIGDIIFFRPHGFFELAEHEGKKHYVVRCSSEFILGIIKHATETNNVAEVKVPQ